MADADAPNVPRCALKVDVQCCPGCPRKLKKKLLKINGVDAIEIDTKKGLVLVRGIVRPSILIRTISEKLGKEAKLYAYEKNPEIQNETLDKGNGGSDSEEEEKNQTCSFADKCKENVRGKDHQGVRNVVKNPVPEGPKKKLPGFASWFGKKGAVEPRPFGGPRPGYNPRLPPPPPLPPPPLPPAFQRPSYRFGQYPQGPQPQVYPYSQPYLQPPLAYPQPPPYPPQQGYPYRPQQGYPYSPPYRITKPPRPYPYDFYEDTGPTVGNSVFHTFRDDNVNACTIS